MCADQIILPEASGLIPSKRRYAEVNPRYLGGPIAPFNGGSRYFPVKSRYFGVQSDFEEGIFSGLIVFLIARKSLWSAALCDYLILSNYCVFSPMLESDTKHAIPLALPGIPTGPADRGGKHNGLAATFHQGRPGPWHPPETSGWPWPTP